MLSFARLSSLFQMYMCGKRAHIRSMLIFFMKYMHAIGQHECLLLANGLLPVQMFSLEDKLRTVSRGMPGVKKKREKKDIFKIENGTNIRIFEYSGPALVERS